MRYLITFFFSSLSYYAHCQSSGSVFCGTQPSYSVDLVAINQHRLQESTNDTIVFRLFVHVVRTSAGFGGQPMERVNEAICVLREDFAPHNIFFNVQEINYIDNDYFFNFTSAKYDSLNHQYGHSSGIDLVLLDDLIYNKGFAKETGYTMSVIGGYLWGSYLAYSHTVSHEVGHNLGLEHTHKNAIGPPGCTNCCNELVTRGSGANCQSCGDFICDTPADPKMVSGNTNEVDSITCLWTPEPHDTDITGATYNPDEKNIMSWSRPACMDYFTSGQNDYIRAFLANSPFLQACTTNVGPQPFAGSDLFMRDTPEDYGQSPSPGISTAEGPDIWYRNTNDGLVNQYSEQLNYTGQDFYVYVRVSNIGCSDYTPGSTQEQLSLYWSKLGTAQSWPSHWDGTYPDTGNMVSNSISLPAIPASEDTVFEFPWDMSSHLQPSTGKVQACLLARIEGVPDDPTNQNSTLYQDVKHENNLTMKNLIIRDAQFFRLNNWVNMFFGGMELEEANFNLYIKDRDQVHPIFKEAEVNLRLDDLIWDRWQTGGFQSEGIEIVNEEEHLIRALNSGAQIKNLHFNQDERGLIDIKINFLVEEVTSKNEFNLHFQQSTVPTDADSIFIGATNLKVYKEPRQYFEADAGKSVSIDYLDTVQITAFQINEVAVYNWYDSEGNLIYSGTTLEVSPEVTETYQLEIIADNDGYKNYDTVQVHVNEFHVSSINPNPAGLSVNVQYAAKNANSAYLMLVETTTSNIVNNYLIDTKSSSITIDLSGLNSGSYTLALICNGQIHDVHNLIIQ